jgi:hypothetical protein
VQGFNFIVGRLLKVNQNEEEVFWIFTQILETVLPLNFYSEMAGLMIDVDILLCLISKYFPDLIAYMDEIFFLDYFKNILFQWFLSLFIQNFSHEGSLAIMDILLLDKSIVLFKCALSLVKYSAHEIKKCDSLENFKNYLKDTFINFKDINFLKYFTILKKFEFNSEILDKNRIILEPAVKEYIEKININKQNKLKEKIKAIHEDCDEDWPICVYDSESVYKVYDNFVCRQGSQFEIIEDYFSRSSKYGKIVGVFKKHKLCYETALVERKIHICLKDKRKKKESGISAVLEQIHNLDDSSLTGINSTGTDKSFDVISLGNKSTEKSFDRSIEQDEFGSSGKKVSRGYSPCNFNSQYELNKRKYKNFSKTIYNLFILLN